MKKSFKNSPSPKVSIIIVNYNTRDILLKCLRSIADDSLLPPTEIIVVDNASSDGSSEALQQEFPKVQLIKNMTNRGLASADNQGIKVAKGKYIMFLNTDAFVAPGSIGRLLEELSKHDDIGAVAPRFLNKDGTIQPSCFPDINVTSTFLAYWLNKKHLVEKYYPDGDLPAKIDYAVTSAILLKKSVLQKLKGEDEKYFLYFQDLDLCHRIRKLGYSMIYLPSATVTHLHGASGQTKEGFGYLRETLLYPLKKTFNSWKPTTSQEYFLEGSIRYFGWFRHFLITLLIKLSPSDR